VPREGPTPRTREPYMSTGANFLLLAVTLWLACAESTFAADNTSNCGATQHRTERVATLRPDANSELLALKFSKGLTADQRVYDRIVRDITAIRTTEPNLRGVEYLPPYDGTTLLIGIDGASRRLLDKGRYHAWDCLNSRYGGHVEPGDLGEDLSVHFERIYNLQRLAAIYAKLPGVRRAESDSTTTFERGPMLCASKTGGQMHYVFKIRSPACAGACDRRKLYYFMSETSGLPESVGAWDVPESSLEVEKEKPSWARSYWTAEQCR
jgi:hypothetical protein